MKFTMKQLITHSIMFLLMLVSVIAQVACQKQPVSMLGVDADANRSAPQAKPLPRVLLIGDSICGGYCKGVRAKLAGKAVVVKPADNGRDTWRGLEKLDEWLGAGKWDVIHFNWGLWDVAYRAGGTRGPGGLDKVNGKLTTTPEDYEKNLRELVGRLKAIGATLIWASSTPVPADEPGRFEGDAKKYNAIAKKIMEASGIAIDDLHAAAAARGMPNNNNVHTLPDLSPNVVASIRAALLARDSLTEKASASYPHKPGKIQTRLSSINAVPFDRVRVNDLFWAPRIERIQDVTIPDLLKIAEEQGKIDNLRIIAGRKKTGRIRVYNSPDSDIWKIMEAASYTLAWRDDPGLAQKLDELISLYAEAQGEDGYINQMYMLPVDHPQSPAKYRQGRYGKELQFKGTIDEWAKGIGQLYSSGHLFEAAAAHYRATGKQNFLQIAIRMADRIYREFPPGEPINYADHPQAGIGLIKLYEVTVDEKYLRLADHIVHHGHHGRPPDLGKRESWRPIEQQRKAWGHAVRINYLYSAATDLCRYLDQPGTRVALDSLWHSIAERRIYVTGGVGGPAHAEQLADDYVLDNRSCYCECCSNIAHGQWNHRLNLLYGDAAYADVVEIEGYNAGLAGISLKGTEYFYANKLAVGKQGRSGPYSGVRKRYLFCCPAKLPGFVAGIGRWVYAKDARGVYVNLYVGGSATVDLPNCSVGLIQKTSYPWNGHVLITVEPDSSGPFDLCLRIPGWAQGQPFPSDLYRFDDASLADWVVKINGERVDATELDKGYVRLRRAWNSGDRVELDFPMPVRRVYACENVKDDRGRVALMRGPIVYCLEGVDHDFSVLSMVLPKKAKIEAEHREDLLDGVTVLNGRGLTGRDSPVEFVAVPYYAWQNRGIDEMTVWIVEDPHVLSPDRGDSISAKNPADPTASDSMSPCLAAAEPNTLDTMENGRTSVGASDKAQVRTTRRPKEGTTERALAKSSEPDTLGKSPVKVFILAGQSNMEGQGKIRLEPNRNQGKGTLEYLVKHPATAERFRHIVDDKGDWVTRKDVWIWYLGRKGDLTVGYGARDDRIGPEFQFGHVIGDYFENQVFLIKTAWGGKSLAKDFRPPSSGGEVGPYYTEMIRDVKDVPANLKEHFADYDGGGYEIAGFGWHQGWNDGCNIKDTNQYEENLINFIRDIRREFGNKDIPFVIANSGFGGWKQKVDRRLKIIQAQAAPLKHKEFEGTVACVETRDFFRPPEVSPSRQGYHWNSNAETYFLIGDSMGRAMIKLCARKTVNGGHRIDCVHPTSMSHILRPTSPRLIPNFPTFQLSDFLFFSWLPSSL